MLLFENITKAKLKDAFFDEVQDRMLFIVQEGQLWKALGPQSKNIKKLEKRHPKGFTEKTAGRKGTRIDWNKK